MSAALLARAGTAEAAQGQSGQSQPHQAKGGWLREGGGIAEGRESGIVQRAARTGIRNEVGHFGTRGSVEPRHPGLAIRHIQFPSGPKAKSIGVDRMLGVTKAPRRLPLVSYL